MSDRHLGFSPFTLSKIKRLLEISGQDYEVLRRELNEYGEPQEEGSIYTIRGILHPTVGYISTSLSEGSLTRSKPSNQILTLWKEIPSPLYISGKDLRAQDIIKVNDKTYRVSGVSNLGEFNLIADISLEVIDEWND